MLKKGIYIKGNYENLKESVFINSGTELNKNRFRVRFNNINDFPKYEENAYVAKQDWRYLKRLEESFLFSNKKTYDYNSIFLGEIPKDIQKSLKEISLHECLTEKEVMHEIFQNKESFKKINSKLNKFIETFSETSNYRFLDIGINYPNLETTARDLSKIESNYTFQDIKHLGIHNDISNKAISINNSYKYGNRICINIGKEPRIFYFINLTIKQAYNMLLKKVNKEEIDIRNISSLFCEKFPNYPLVKIIQKPFQYYIAPTDNCFHDGSTLGNKGMDINLVYLGHFYI